MFRLLALCLMVVLSQGIQGQLLVNYPYNPDEDDNQMIGSPDLLGFLSYYGEPFTPEPILVDSMDLGSVLTSMQQTIVGLQSQLDSLQLIISACTDASGTGLSIICDDSEVVNDVNLLEFIGDGVAANQDEIDLHKVNITVPASNSVATSGVYVLKLKFTSGGALEASPNHILDARDPAGNSLIGSWTFNRDSDYIMTVTHNQNRLPVNIMTHASNTAAGGYISRHIYITSTSNNTVVSNPNEFKITGLRNTLIGLDGTIAYLTFQFPDNNILIE
jgi:hypothetical protein